MGITSIRLNAEIEAPLQNLAEKLDRSKNYLINQAIKEFLARQAMADERWNDTLEALESVRAGKGVDEEQVSAWLDSWGTENEKTPPKV